MQVNIDYLRRLRRQKKMNLSDVAQLVGKDRSTVWRYENGKVEMPTEVLFILADFYQVNVDSLRWQEPKRGCEVRSVAVNGSDH
jgi:transcriptional regulator with XRE-family HTH domain